MQALLFCAACVALRRLCLHCYIGVILFLGSGSSAVCVLCFVAQAVLAAAGSCASVGPPLQLLCAVAAHAAAVSCSFCWCIVTPGACELLQEARTQLVCYITARLGRLNDPPVPQPSCRVTPL
jgi:hypothetical protein